MDKEIIIDGVDVAGCEFIGDIKNEFVKCTSWVHNSKKQVSGHWDCRENKNCYYKQLKRLQQDYVNLSKSFEHLKTSYQENQEYVIQLKDENAELKAENERLQKLTCFNCGEETLSPSGAELYDKILVYKQTLQEIKAIAESAMAKQQEYKKDFEQILDLITKAEEK